MSLGGIAKKLVFSLFPILFLVPIPALPENVFWEVKDYRHWSEQECEKMLTNSPWAKEVFNKSSAYVAQLFSALPIRQASVRQKQIAGNYENLSPEKRDEFDKRTEEYLSEHFHDRIVVRVVHRGQLWPYWQMQTTDMLRNSVFLIPSKGDRIPLQQFIVSQGAFQFIFPRQYKSRPVLSEQDKSLLLEFTAPAPKTSLRPSDIVPGIMEDFDRVLIEFKVSKMKFDGELVY